MKFTYYGQSSFSVEVKGKKILFDPFIVANELAKDIDIHSIEADYILLSHGHMDHVADALTIAQNTKAKIVSNFEVATWFSTIHQYENIHPMNHGGKWDFDFGTVRYVTAVHSSMMPDRSYGGHSGGFVITSEEGNFYFAGDTALTMDMKLIPLWAKLNFAVLPIGDNFTMGFEDAAIAAEFIECDKIIGVHYDTFGYIKINHDEAKKAFTDKNKELILLNIGETINID